MEVVESLPSPRRRRTRRGTTTTTEEKEQQQHYREEEEEEWKKWEKMNMKIEIDPVYHARYSSFSSCFSEVICGAGSTTAFGVELVV